MFNTKYLKSFQYIEFRTNIIWFSFDRIKLENHSRSNVESFISVFSKTFEFVLPLFISSASLRRFMKRCVYIPKWDPQHKKYQTNEQKIKNKKKQTLKNNKTKTNIYTCNLYCNIHIYFVSTLSLPFQVNGTYYFFFSLKVHIFF